MRCESWLSAWPHCLDHIISLGRLSKENLSRWVAHAAVSISGRVHELPRTHLWLEFHFHFPVPRGYLNNSCGILWQRQGDRYQSDARSVTVLQSQPPYFAAALLCKESFLRHWLVIVSAATNEAAKKFTLYFNGHGLYRNRCSTEQRQRNDAIYRCDHASYAN